MYWQVDFVTSTDTSILPGRFCYMCKYEYIARYVFLPMWIRVYCQVCFVTNGDTNILPDMFSYQCGYNYIARDFLFTCGDTSILPGMFCYQRGYEYIVSYVFLQAQIQIYCQVYQIVDTCLHNSMNILQGILS